jgi:hypothetical protein
MQVVQALVGSLKPHGKFGNTFLIVAVLANFLGFTKYRDSRYCSEMFCMQLLEVILSDVPVTIDSPLQQPCPLTTQVVVDWGEEFVYLGVCQLCRDKSARKMKALPEGRRSVRRLDIRRDLLPVPWIERISLLWSKT